MTSFRGDCRFDCVWRGYGSMLAEGVEAAGIVDFTFHYLRHTFASHVVMKGGDIRTLDEQLGHRSLKQLMKYSHCLLDIVRRVNRLDGVFGKRSRISCYRIVTGEQPPTQDSP